MGNLIMMISLMMILSCDRHMEMVLRFVPLLLNILWVLNVMILYLCSCSGNCLSSCRFAAILMQIR